MFPKLPDLFSKEFAVGHFVPAITAVVAIVVLLAHHGTVPDALLPATGQSLLEAAYVVGIAWLAALGLLALNRTILRFLQGYHSSETSLYGDAFQLPDFRALAAPMLALQSRVDEALRTGAPLPDIPDDYGERLRKAVRRFPDNENYVLPSAIGNRWRAGEVYPRVVYGLDAVPAWPRLEQLIPAEFKARIASAKSELDFAANMQVVAVLVAVIHLAVSAAHQAFEAGWLLFAALAVMVVARLAMRPVVEQYVDYINAAFDLHRDLLADALGLEMPRNGESEREMWDEVSRMMVYRSAGSWDRLTRFRKLPKRDV